MKNSNDRKWSHRDDDFSLEDLSWKESTKGVELGALIENLTGYRMVYLLFEKAQKKLSK